MISGEAAGGRAVTRYGFRKELTSKSTSEGNPEAGPLCQMMDVLRDLHKLFC